MTSNRIHPGPLLDDQRRLIEDLARSKAEYTRNFEALTLAIEASSCSQRIGEAHVFNRSSEAQSSPNKSPSPSPSPPPLDQPSRIIYELKHYGKLINKLLREIDVVEYRIEPLVGSRIRDDIILTHQREANRLRSLHGRRRLKATITGVAWDVIKTKSDSGESDPSAAENNMSDHSLLLTYIVLQVCSICSLLVVSYQ